MPTRRPALVPTERVLVDIRPHWVFLTGPLVAAAVVVAIGIVLDVSLPDTSVDLHWVEGALVAVPCLWLAVRVVRWRRQWLLVTTFRIVDQWGVSRGNRIDIPLSSVEGVVVVDGTVRRLLGTGAIDVVVWEQGVFHRILDVRKPVVLARIVSRRLDARPYPTEPESRPN